MAERIENSRAGLPVAVIHERALHSRYDPRKEAEKYIESLRLSGGILFFILIEPGLGYIIPVLRERFPEAEICALHITAFLAEQQDALFPGANVFSPGGEAARNFLEREIPELPAARVKIIGWRPSLDAFGGAYTALLREAAEFLRRNDAGSRSAAYFGRRWVKNFFRNLSLIRKTAVPGKTDARPWIVCAAGPSLEESAGEIAEMKRAAGAEILAVSAALPALYVRGIECAAVIAADGGNWGLFHLYEMRRRSPSPPPPLPVLAVSATAALPSQCGEFPLLVIADGSLWQEAALAGAEIPHISAAARGTVSAAAIDLALALTEGPVIACGMDFENAGIKMHARPYALDRFHEDGAARLSPAHSAAFARAGLLEKGESFRVYAEWFRGQLDHWPDRVYSLGKNHALFAGREVSAGDPRGKTERNPGSDGRRMGEHAVFSENPLPREKKPVRDAVLALEKILTGNSGGQAIPGGRVAEELGPLLFPGETSFSPEKTFEAIKNIAERYGGP